MIVSTNWLSDYVSLRVPQNQLVERLTMSGLNYEGSQFVEGDQAIDLEVTSNRPDCLGHIGVAREISTLFETALTVPDPQTAAAGPSINDSFSVEIQAHDLCYRFTARLIRGIKVGPSPSWLAERLTTVGVTPVNNIVDISNYVMLECGQPLHTFDYQKLRGQKIIVRQPEPGEELEAINHHRYALETGMCVIADADRAVGLGGVMGGADTEVTDQTTDLLIEAAYFNPIAIRNTARQLNLFSLASHRFERAIDSHQIDWASRRCCQLILETAGGELAEGCVDVGQAPTARTPIVLRLAQLKRILGISIPAETSRSILTRLGFDLHDPTDDAITVVPPTWRLDVTREVDLIEEVGRIHGYDNVPDDGRVPMAATVRSPIDRTTEKIRHAMTASGFDEAVTASLITRVWSDTFSPWTETPPIESRQPMLGVLEKASQNLGQVNLLRRSILPSLLEVFRINEYKVNQEINLFEIARVYLPQPGALPEEPLKLAIVTEERYDVLKGVIETLLHSLNPSSELGVHECDFDALDLTRSAGLTLGDRLLGYLGEVSEQTKRTFAFRRDVAIADLDMDCLISSAVLIPTQTDVSPYPPISRDFNFIVDESVRWIDLCTVVKEACGELLESIRYKETFRDPEKDGENKKRLLLSVALRSQSQTLTGEQADGVCEDIIRNCQTQLQAKLLG